MRFANVPVYPGDHIKHPVLRNIHNSYVRNQKKLDERGPAIPLTAVTYPQDSMPASFFGVDPAELGIMRDRYIQSPDGGVSSNQPGMYKDFLDRGEDGGYELFSSGIDPELQRALNEQKLFFDTGVMGGPGRS